MIITTTTFGSDPRLATKNRLPEKVDDVFVKCSKRITEDEGLAHFSRCSLSLQIALRCWDLIEAVRARSDAVQTKTEAFN